MIPQLQPKSFPVICAWCGMVCSQSTVQETSGICKPCLDRMLASIHDPAQDFAILKWNDSTTEAEPLF